MRFQGYGACCRRHAADRSARVCPECGHLLLRCTGFDECQALVDLAEHCPEHVAPRLFLERGAAQTARVGQRITLPLVLHNASRLPGALKIERVLKGEGGHGLQEIPLYWDQLRPGEERSLAIDSGKLEAGGTTRIDLVVVLSASPGGIESSHAFAAELIIAVDEPEASPQITQHIHIEGGHYEAGASAVVQTGPSISEASAFDLRGDAPDQRIAVASFQRAEAFELREGVRGYAESRVHVPRTVELRCAGFDREEVPAMPRPFLERWSLALGRNSQTAGERNAAPNDIVLRARDAAGAVDRERTLRISGQHARLGLHNGRLMVTATGTGPTFVNGETLERGATRVVARGDRVGVLGPRADDLGFTIDTVAQGAVVESITLTKTGR